MTQDEKVKIFGKIHAEKIPKRPIITDGIPLYPLDKNYYASDFILPGSQVKVCSFEDTSFYKHATRAQKAEYYQMFKGKGSSISPEFQGKFCHSQNVLVVTDSRVPAYVVSSECVKRGRLEYFKRINDTTYSVVFSNLHNASHCLSEGYCILTFKSVSSEGIEKRRTYKLNFVPRIDLDFHSPVESVSPSLSGKKSLSGPICSSSSKKTRLTEQQIERRKAFFGLKKKETPWILEDPSTLIEEKDEWPEVRGENMLLIGIRKEFWDTLNSRRKITDNLQNFLGKLDSDLRSKFTDGERPEMIMKLSMKDVPDFCFKLSNFINPQNVKEFFQLFLLEECVEYVVFKLDGKNVVIKGKDYRSRPREDIHDDRLKHHNNTTIIGQLNERKKRHRISPIPQSHHHHYRGERYYKDESEEEEETRHQDCETFLKFSSVHTKRSTSPSVMVRMPHDSFEEKKADPWDIHLSHPKNGFRPNLVRMDTYIPSQVDCDIDSITKFVKDGEKDEWPEVRNDSELLVGIRKKYRKKLGSRSEIKGYVKNFLRKLDPDVIPKFTDEDGKMRIKVATKGVPDACFIVNKFLDHQNVKDFADYFLLDECVKFVVYKLDGKNVVVNGKDFRSANRELRQTQDTPFHDPHIHSVDTPYMHSTDESDETKQEVEEEEKIIKGKDKDSSSEDTQEETKSKPKPKHDSLTLTSASTITSQCIIGHGGFGEVLLVKVDGIPFPCVLKKMLRIADKTVVKGCRKEFKVQLKLFNNPKCFNRIPRPLYILDLLDSDMKGVYGFLMEFCVGGSVSAFAKSWCADG
ncbi:hypothetical protein ADUPG1_013189, partial [Aduncisulcus paluster]